MAGLSAARLRRPALQTLYFVTGGAGYGALEILWRGETHVSMLLAGGVCLLLLLRISVLECRLPLLCAVGALVITGVEFAFGCVVNLWMGLGVWDYSSLPLHLWGQICPYFTALWYGLCILILPLCRSVTRLERRLLRSWAENEKQILPEIHSPVLLYADPNTGEH